MSVEERSPSVIRISGSTVALVIAAIAATAGVRLLWPAAIPTAVRVWFTYAIWPISSAIAAVWASWKLVRSRGWPRRLRFAIELACALVLLWVFYKAINSPV